MNKYIKFVLFFVAVFCQLPIYAQSGLTVGGVVMSESGEPQIGASVVIKENPSKGTISDLDGHFRITGLQKNQTLVFSLIGFGKIEIKIEKSDERMRVVMKEIVNELDEAVVVGHSTQRKISVTGAITNVEVKDLKVPATSVANMLGGRIPGIISQLRSGEPGKIILISGFVVSVHLVQVQVLWYLLMEWKEILIRLILRILKASLY
jgi:hypothetical protein